MQLHYCSELESPYLVTSAAGDVAEKGLGSASHGVGDRFEGGSVIVGRHIDGCVLCEVCMNVGLRSVRCVLGWFYCKCQEKSARLTLYIHKFILYASAHIVRKG